ncbi:MAG: glutamate formimidoyltransferase [Chloroflexota bacterium]
MTMPLIECVPNFSEGRRPEVIRAITDAIESGDAHILDVSSDVDHNRTVVTLVGGPTEIVEAAYQGIYAASKLIDLTKHRGVHPRIGATDVVPLIPLRGTTMDECVLLARSLGKRVAEELNLPVFLYEAAATHPSRQNLADIRRGGYERLQARMDANDLFSPDYGPAKLGPAGAVVIGAREPLIAYNAYLDTDDVSVAKSIARQVRASGGGLPNLKAIGLEVDGRAQVSMNVIDFRQTSLFTITETVRAAATQRGTKVVETELVGLVPQGALIDAALSYLGLPSDVRAKTLEFRMGAVTQDYREITFE